MGGSYYCRYDSKEYYMNKLWIYGCSFSEPFGFEQTGPVFDVNGYRNIKVPYWGTHLAEKLNLTCITRSLAGVGWNYITFQIEQDVRSWSKDDIIIISPSFLSRVNIMEFTNGSTRDELIGFYKSWDEIAKYNKTRWRNTILNYQYLGYNVYTWLVEHVDELPPKTIFASDNEANWYNWMTRHYEYWTSLPGIVYPDGDWHFNARGHVAVADRMYEVICKQQ